MPSGAYSKSCFYLHFTPARPNPPLPFHTALGAVLLVPVNQPRRARIVPLDILLITQLRQNVLGEHLAQLDTHLVIRVDTPDSALHVNLVLVHGNQRAEGTGSELLEHDRVGGLVAFEDFRLDESFVG